MLMKILTMPPKHLVTLWSLGMSVGIFLLRHAIPHPMTKDRKACMRYPIHIMKMLPTADKPSFRASLGDCSSERALRAASWLGMSSLRPLAPSWRKPSSKDSLLVPPIG